MVKGLAEMATLRKQNKRLQDKMTQLRKLCDQQQAENQSAVQVRTQTGFLFLAW